jgi:hypothetical protein
MSLEATTTESPQLPDLDPLGGKKMGKLAVLGLRRHPKKKREPGRRGRPGSLRRRKDVLSTHTVTYESINWKSLHSLL